MANVMFSYEQFDFGVQDKYNSSKGLLSGVEGESKEKQTEYCGTGDWGESGIIKALCSDFGVYQENTCQEGFSHSKYQLQLQQQQQEQAFSDYGFFDDLHFDIASPPMEPCLEEITKLVDFPTEVPKVMEEAKKEKRSPFCLASFEILNNCGSGFKRLNGEKIIEPSFDTTCTKVGDRELSTEEVMRVAGESFIQTYSPGFDGFSMLSHPFSSYFSGLSDEEIRDVELAVSLFALAEKVSNQQFDCARRLFDQCYYLSSNKGNPVQRVVYYFSEALREKIDRENGGGITMKGSGKKELYDIDEAMMSLNSTNLACHQGIPFSQVAQFAGIQAILDHVSKAKKVHVIDFGIRSGVQWTALIQALAALHKPLELLKITAVGTTSRQKIEETGKRLDNFAQSMNLPFIFKVVMVPDMLDLKVDLFELNAEEAVAVSFPFVLRTMISQPNRLESMMRVVRNINPCIVLLTEVEANHNSPVFVYRFIEALFWFSAYFDCLGACLDQDDPNRMIVESIYFSQGIQNIVAAEGEERTTRHVNISVWRAFFARFGMMETELSMSSMYQASLVLKEFACGHSCTLDLDNKSLIMGWKGTPIHSLSAWKFF